VRTIFQWGPKLRGLKCLNPSRQIRTKGVRRPKRNSSLCSACMTEGVREGHSEGGGEAQQRGIRNQTWFRRKFVLKRCDPGGIETVHLLTLNTKPRGGGAEGGDEMVVLPSNARGMAISLGQVPSERGPRSRGRTIQGRIWSPTTAIKVGEHGSLQQSEAGLEEGGEGLWEDLT
jgi:hypothetical protein